MLVDSILNAPRIADIIKKKIIILGQKNPDVVKKKY